MPVNNTLFTGTPGVSPRPFAEAPGTDRGGIVIAVLARSTARAAPQPLAE